MAGLDFLLGAQGDDQNAARMGLLAAGLGMLANNTGHYGAAGPAIGAGGLAGMQAYQGTLEAQAQDQYKRAQMGELQRKQQAAQAQQQALANFSAGGQADPRALLTAGVPVETVKAMVEAPNWGRAKIKDRIEMRMPDGSVKSVGLDEYGQTVGEGVTPYKAPMFQDLGGSVIGIDPVTMQPVYRAGKSMTPGEAASNAVARANLGIAQQRLQMDQNAPKGQIVQTEAGPMLVDTRNGAASPLTDASGAPLKGVAKAPTEYQSKSAGFGARAEAADKLVNSLSYSPAMIAGVNTARNMPFVGGITGPAVNAAADNTTLQAKQAIDDFISAKLRLESGAVIGPDEFKREYEMFFPQPGEGKKIAEQKARARQIVIQGLRNSAGPAAFSAAPSQAQNRPSLNSIFGK